jgi:uncharacterized membrane protein YcaP (DUF421 family)
VLSQSSRSHGHRAAVIIYVVVFAFTRALGRRELSTLQPFDLILLIVIGDLIQSGVTQNDLSVTGVLLILCTIGSLQVLSLDPPHN